MASRFYFVLLVALLALSQAEVLQEDEEIPERNGVFVLDSNTFKFFVDHYKYVFLYFKTQEGTEEDLQITKVLEQMSPILRKNVPKLFIAEINLATYPDIQEILFIKQTPFFRLYVDLTRYSDYKSTLELNEAVSWILTKTNLPSKEVHQAEQLEQLIIDKTPLVVFVGSLEGQNYISFQEVAKMMISEKGIIFRHVPISKYSKQIKDLLRIESSVIKDYTISVINPNGNSIQYNEEKIDHLSLKSFIIMSIFSNLKEKTLTSITQTSMSKVLVYHKSIMIVFNGKSGWGDYASTVESFLPQIDSINLGLFVHKADFQNKLDGDVASILKIKQREEPQLWIVDFTDLHRDAQNWVDKTIKPYFISEEITPESTYENGVMKLTGNTYESIVNDPAKEVMVFFYTKKCELCQVFMKTYEKAAIQLKGHKNLILAKIDMGQNELKEKIEIYPMVRFHCQSHKQKGVEYDKGTEISKLLEFISKHEGLYLKDEEHEFIKEDL